MSFIEPASDYYFVPWGRERGGYLDVLGLTPDASESAAAAAEREYRQSIREEFRQGNATLIAQLKKEEITVEQRDRIFAERSEKRNDQLSL